MNHDEEPGLAPLSTSGEPSESESSICRGEGAQQAGREDESSHGLLIVNADDWGRDRETTDRTLECVHRGTVSSVSAMMFMEDTERAVAIARERGIDAGLHINLTTPFSARNCPSRLTDHQRELASYLRRYHPVSRIVYHPGLVRSFEYVVAAQRSEYVRLFGLEAERVDGHHHVHLCSNVLFGGLLPVGAIARRNFSFQRGEKGWVNRFYRLVVDRILARHHRLTDFFFSLDPVDEPGRVKRMFSLASRFVVEVATHPANSEDFQFLTSDEILQLTRETPIAARFVLPWRDSSEKRNDL